MVKNQSERGSDKRSLSFVRLCPLSIQSKQQPFGRPDRRNLAEAGRTVLTCIAEDADALI